MNKLDRWLEQLEEDIEYQRRLWDSFPEELQRKIMQAASLILMFCTIFVLFLVKYYFGR